jgi:uncharacterized protein YjbI with pentapeptide repeats
VNFEFAKLQRANFSGADLSNADLAGADLTEANLTLLSARCFHVPAATVETQEC